MTEGLGASVPRCYLLALGWKTREDTPALAAVRINRAEGWAVTQASVRKRVCCSAAKNAWSRICRVLTMAGWYHRFNGHEFEQTPGDGEGQRSL